MNFYTLAASFFVYFLLHVCVHMCAWPLVSAWSAASLPHSCLPANERTPLGVLTPGSLNGQWKNEAVSGEKVLIGASWGEY